MYRNTTIIAAAWATAYLLLIMKGAALVSPSIEWKRWCTDAEDRLLHVAELDCPDEPEHQHQFLPWLSLPNGSSWTGCASCDWQYQYDHPYR